MRRKVTLAAFPAVFAVLWAAGPAASAQIATRGLPLTPVLSGGGALWTESSPSGGFAVKAGSAGRGQTTVQRLRPENPNMSEYLAPALAGSDTLTLAGNTAFARDPFSVAQAYTEVYGGSRLGPLSRVARCGGTRVNLRSFDVSGDAYAYHQCDDAGGHVEIRDLGSPPLGPARSVGSGGFGARIAGRYVAWLDGSYHDDVTYNTTDIVVYDRVAGTEVYRVPAAELPGLIQSLDVQADGKVAFAFAPTDRNLTLVVGWASPQEPHVHRLPLKPMTSYDVHLAGDTIAFERGNAPNGVVQDAEVGISDLAGRAHIVGRHADDYLFQESLDYDGQSVLWRHLGCSRAELVIRNAASVAGSTPPPRCPLKLLRRPTYKAGRATFAIGCGAFSPPCSFFVELRIGNAHGRLAGRADSKSPVRIKLSKAAQHTLKHRRSIRLHLTVSISDDALRCQDRTATITLRR